MGRHFGVSEDSSRKMTKVNNRMHHRHPAHHPRAPPSLASPSSPVTFPPARISTRSRLGTEQLLTTPNPNNSTRLECSRACPHPLQEEALETRWLTTGRWALPSGARREYASTSAPGAKSSQRLM